MTTNTTSFHGSNNTGLLIGTNYGQLNISRNDLASTDAEAATKLQKDKERCHQLFRLVEGDGSEGYERYKEDIPSRAEGTCQWFLSHANYLSWKERSSGMLLVSADPGCGKSVLMKYLIDHEIEGKACYFFFRDTTQNSLKQVLCAILHQLFSHTFGLIDHAMPYYTRNGPKLPDLTDILWQIFCSAIKDPRAGPITVVIDALDECRDADLRRLITLLTTLFPDNETPFGEAKLILSSRPYGEIISEFWKLADIFPSIRISGEEHSDQISQEVTTVIRSRVIQLCKKWRVKDDLRTYLENKLLTVPNRTYLWVVLVFDHLDRLISRNKKTIGHVIDNIPESVAEAYEKILQRCKDQTTLRRILSILLAATRPLTVTEMNVALQIETNPRTQSVFEIDCEDNDTFRESLREYCALFISIQDDRVFFIHQTAREFLLPRVNAPLEEPPKWQWFGSISSEEAHSILAELCIILLNLGDLDTFTDEEFFLEHQDLFEDLMPFCVYSNANWSHHFRSALPERRIHLATYALAICTRLASEDPHWALCETESAYEWLGRTEDARIRMWQSQQQRYPGTSRLDIACHLGLCEVITGHLAADDLEYRSPDGSTALLHSASMMNASVVRALLDIGADVHAEDPQGETALVKALDADTVRVLVAYNATLEARTKETGRTALHTLPIRSFAGAATPTQSSVDTVRALLECGADVNAQDYHGETALHLADRWKREDIIVVLLEFGADFMIKNSRGRMPFYLERRSDADVIVERLKRLSKIAA